MNLKHRVFSALLVVLATMFGAPASAQDGDGEDSIVCVTIAYHWRGTQEERRRIQTVPVPASFLDHYNAGGCRRFQLILGSLVTWHIRFGDEDSTKAAIRFWEREFAVLPKPVFHSELRSAWPSALIDARQLIERERADEPSKPLYLLREQILNLRSVKKLTRAGAVLSGNEFVLNEYVRASESFGSSQLLSRAQELHPESREALEFLQEQAALGDVERFLADLVGPSYRSDRLLPDLREIKLTALKAQLEGTPDAIAQAGETTIAFYAPDGKSYPWPDLLTFYLKAFEETDQACNFSESNSRAGYQDRCEENGFEEFAFGFWNHRSQLELLAIEQGIELPPLAQHLANRGRLVDQTIDLFMRKGWNDGFRYGEQEMPYEVIRLLMAKSRAELAQIGTRCVAGSGGDRGLAYEALQPLVRAQSLSDPVENPWLHAEVARALIDTHGSVEGCTQELGEPSFDRALFLARAFLDSYAQIEALER